MRTREELLDLLQEALQYIVPTTGTHEEIATLLHEERGFVCPCGYCHKQPEAARCSYPRCTREEGHLGAHHV